MNLFLIKLSPLINKKIKKTSKNYLQKTMKWIIKIIIGLIKINWFIGKNNENALEKTMKLLLTIFMTHSFVTGYDVAFVYLKTSILEALDFIGKPFWTA